MAFCPPNAKLRRLFVPKESDQAGQGLESAAAAECETEAARFGPAASSGHRYSSKFWL
jgi:hypothetical protein